MRKIIIRKITPLKFISRISPTRICCFFGILLLLQIALFAETNVQINTESSQKYYAPGDTVIIALNVSIPDKFHLYGNPLGPGIGKPLTIINTTESNDIHWVDITKTSAEKFYPAIGDWVWAYKKNTLFFLHGIIDKASNSNISCSFQLNGLICNTSCIPISKNVNLNIKINNEQKKGIPFNDNQFLRNSYTRANEKMNFEVNQVSTMNAGVPLNIDLKKISTTTPSVSLIKNVTIDQPSWQYSPKEYHTKFNFWIAILFGFIAGIILNFMPCVLPVLGIKILSFSQASSEKNHTALLKSLIFSVGILSVFMILAALASFANYSWGEQFQNPNVLAGIITLIVIFAFGMFDLFTINIPGSIGNLERKSGNGLIGDYFRGAFATILATPCSGPFLGATLAWALSQSALVIFIVFISIGLGMSFPYVLLSASKPLRSLVPKPGRWMKDFKILMGFILIGFSIYLMIGLPQDMILSTIAACVIIIFSIFIYNRFVPWDTSSLSRKITVLTISLIVALSGIYFSFGVFYKSFSHAIANETATNDQWVGFNSEVLRNANDKGENVVVDFTANWCMNCQYNKIAILNSKEIQNLIRSKNVLTIKADITTPNKEIESLMKNLGSTSVPFFAIFPGNNPQEPIVMRDILNKKILSKTLKNLPDKK